MQKEKKYPIGGYAPGNYYCKCSSCGYEFQGDKRAVQCEPCAVADKEKFDALPPEEQEALMKKNASIARYMFSGPLSPERDLIYRIAEQWGNAIEMPNMEQWLKDYAVTQRPATAGWVKAKIRYPEKDDKYFIKQGDVKSAANLWQSTKEYWQSTDMEWLDESNEHPVEQKENEAIVKLLEFARDCAKNWDCDTDGHKYNTGCRKCEAEHLYNEYQKQKEVKP